MGAGCSIPLPKPGPGFQYVAVCIWPHNRIKIFHAPPEVIQRAESILREVNLTCTGKDEVNAKAKDLGFHRLAFNKWHVFTEIAGTTASTCGKLYMLRMLEEMYKMGYDPVVSSDFARNGETATLIFKKVSDERPGRKVICLAPGSSDKFVFLHADDTFYSVVRDAIKDAWTNGIQRESEDHVKDITLKEIKLHGNPWYDWEGEDNVRCREMMIKILGRLGQYNYKLISGINLKNTTDTLFFFKDETYRVREDDFCMVSLNHKDKIRLVGCMEMKDAVLATIANNGNEVQEHKVKYDVYSIKLEGWPWHCSGDQAVKTRRLISRIAETFLAQGWALTGGIDLSRSVDDKSSLIFSRIPTPFSTTFACISLSDDDKIRFLDMPENMVQALSDTLRKNYLPGVQEEKQRDKNCYQFKLKGSPWGFPPNDNAHGRNMMMHLLAHATSLGYQLVCSADVSAKYVHQKNGPDYPVDVHSWWLVYWPSGTQQL